MNLPKMTRLSLIILSIVVLGGWNVISASEAEQTQARAEKPLAASSEEPPAPDLASPAKDLEPPAPAQELPPAVEAGCHVEDCGNTGTRWGVGPEGSPACVNARSDLDSEL